MRASDIVIAGREAAAIYSQNGEIVLEVPISVGRHVVREFLLDGLELSFEGCHILRPSAVTVNSAFNYASGANPDFVPRSQTDAQIALMVMRATRDAVAHHFRGVPEPVLVEKNEESAGLETIETEISGEPKDDVGQSALS